MEENDSEKNLERLENFVFEAGEKNYQMLVVSTRNWDDSSIPGCMYWSKDHYLV